MAAAGNEETAVEQQSRQIENRFTNEEEAIAREFKSPMKDLVTTKFSTMVQELLDDVLETLFHNRRSDIRPVLYNVFDLVILPLLPQDVVKEMSDTRIAMFFDTDAVTERISKMFLPSRSFIRLLQLFRSQTNA